MLACFGDLSALEKWEGSGPESYQAEVRFFLSERKYEETETREVRRA